MPRGRPPKANKFAKFRLERDPNAIERDTSALDGTQVAEKPSDEPAYMKNDATLDSYSEHLEKTPEGILMEKNFEIEELTVHLNAAKEQNQRLMNRIESLKAENMSLKENADKITSETIRPYEARISELESKVNELNQTMSRMSSELKAKDRIIVDKQTQLDTIKHSYTQTGYKNMSMRNSGFVQSMNGYQDWT